MFTGHLGLAFALRATRRDAPLAALLAASVLPDALDLAYATAGFCSPAGLYSHSLPAIAVLAAAAAAATFAWTRSAPVAMVIAAAVLLHAPADWLTGFKYLWADGPIVGLVLYRHPWWDFALEAAVVTGGWLLLRRSPREPRWATGWIVLAALLTAQGVFDGVKKTGAPGKPSACGAEVRARLNQTGR